MSDVSVLCHQGQWRRHLDVYIRKQEETGTRCFLKISASCGVLGTRQTSFTHLDVMLTLTLSLHFTDTHCTNMNRHQIKQTQSNCLDRQSLYTQIQEQTSVRTRWTDAFIDIQQKVHFCMLSSPVSRNNFDNTIAMSQANRATLFLKKQKWQP